MSSTARWLRRFLPLAVLVIVAAGSWTAASAADQDEARLEPESYLLAPVDPVLSARRVPFALQAPIADAALMPHLQGLLAASPPDTCLVVDVDGRLVLAHNPATMLVPASNQKLLTTWAALETLGPDETFRTSVVSTAPVTDGVLAGDLWLVGSGDPFLWTDDWVAQFEDGDEMVRTRLEDLADAIVAAGITQVQGAIVGDESHFDQVRAVPTWADRLLDQNQAGPLSALLVNEGVEQFPDQYVSRRSYVMTPDPAVHAATKLAELLAARGVTAAGPPSVGAAPAEATERAAVQSPPIRELLRGVNAWSNNTAAELLVKAMDRARDGVGTTAGGTQVVREVLDAAALPLEGVVANDGSGLDEGNRSSCGLLHGLLREAGLDSTLAESLSVAGRSGTLRTRFVDSGAEGQVRAKTGTLRNATTLSGFAESSRQPGTVLTFAYMANVREADGVVDLRLIDAQGPLVEALAAYPQAPTTAQLGPRPPQPVS